MENREITIIDSEPVQRVKRTGQALGVYSLLIVTLVLLGVIAYALWLVRAYIVYLGYVTLAGAGVAIVCGVALPVILLARLMFKAEHYDIGPNGLLLRFWGRVNTYAPLAPGQVKVQEIASKKKSEPPMLSMIDMIEQGIIGPGQMSVVIGYSLKGQLEIEPRPYVYAIAGMGRTGKSRRSIMMIVQDVIALAPLMNLQERSRGARVIICDPHPGKKDSLTKVLAPLAPWIEFRGTQEEIAQVSQEYNSEMRGRTQGSSELITEEGNYVPWAIYYDEFSMLMTRTTEDTQELIQECVQASSEEYGGVGGYITLIGQSWTNDSCGGTAVRRALHESFVHNISPEYAKFLIKESKWYNRCESLPIKNCIHKPRGASPRELITPYVPDDIAERVAGVLQELAPVPQLAGAQNVQGLPGARPQEIARPMPEYLGIQSPAGVQEPAQELTYSPAQYGVMQVNTPQELAQESEAVTVQGGNFTMQVKQRNTGELAQEIASPAGDRPGQEDENALYTPEKELRIINAAREIAQEGETVTRERIMVRLNWTRKQWPTIKAVCDKWQIATR